MIEIPRFDGASIAPVQRGDALRIDVQQSIDPSRYVAFIRVVGRGGGYQAAQLTKPETEDLITALQWALARYEQEKSK